MTIEIPDVDLDVKDRDRAASLFKEAVPASQVQEKKLVLHKTGVYFQRVPQDPTNGLAVFPYDISEDFGYFKVDLIPNHVYDMVSSEEELTQLLNKPVDWGWFQDERFFNATNSKMRLTHLSRYYSLCCRFPPKSVEDIAALIAVIRPAKKHLLKECKSLSEIKQRVWVREEEDGYFFKKSHSIAFAMLVVLHAQIIASKLFPGDVFEEDGYFI